jgi:glycyl-tRNA synthetase beta chain
MNSGMNQDNSSNPRPGALPFLLEIGSEEIPARFIPGAMADIERLAKAGLQEAHLSFTGCRVMATPRRLTLMVEGLAERQPDRPLEVKGPPVSVAFDADGNPTPAAQGFARKVGVDLDQCERGEDQRGEFLLVRKTEVGRPAAEVLAEIIPGVVLGIPFRKVMRWGDRDLEYPRPLQWILALLGDQVVPLKIDYLQAGGTTRGHRTLHGDEPVVVEHPHRYEEILRGIGVIVDHKERRRLISEGLADLLSRHEAPARLVVDEELLTEVVFLCEHPTPFLGSFGEDFTALPAQVITTALKAHQRYFSVGRQDGQGLLPCFAAVRDGGTDHLDSVMAGNERVLRARLADALFYWEFDQKKTPDERVDMLETVTWLEGYGSVKDKVERLVALAGWLWENGLGDGQEAPADLLRAALICKSDLVSEMIKDGKEFTKLEGFIGARYAALAGESETVCRALERHYYPKSATDELPGDPISATLSVADRLDNLAGCWLAGFAPTGAKDPYALRRHALAVVRIILGEELRIDLSEALEMAMSRFQVFGGEQSLEQSREEIEEFIRTRLAGYFTDNLSCDADVVRAVLPARWADPRDALAWCGALADYRDQGDFQLLATGFKRCRNILKGEVLGLEQLAACRERWLAGGGGADGEDFGGLLEAAEVDLRQQVAAQAAGLREAEEAGDYSRVFGILSRLGPAIDRFFEEVRVNAEEKDMRLLRHAFLREIHGIFSTYADFSEVASTED